MKKISAILLASLMLVTSAACTTAPAPAAAPSENSKPAAASSESSTASSTPAKDDSIFIGFSLPTQSIERWVKDGENMKALCEAEGIQLAVQMANDDAGKQVSQCENLISQGVDVLVVAPHDAQAAATIVDMAHEANIPVISYDRLILNADVDYYISFDSVEVGKLQGGFAVDNVPEGNYIILSGDPADNNAKLFKQGAMQALQPAIDAGKIKIVTDQAVKGWDPANALKIVEDSLTANQNNIQAIVCPNDGTAGAAVEALSVQGLDGKVVVTGGDCDTVAVKRITKGTQSMTVLKDINVLAQETVKAAKTIAKGEAPAVNTAINNGKIDVPTVMIAPEVVTKENIQSRLVDTGLVSAGEIS